ncbi:MAG: hypothetical protein II222_02780 [Paraprevotella sp.]|nr:hypothetical protein [Paraprevotella sp.]
MKSLEDIFSYSRFMTYARLKWAELRKPTILWGVVLFVLISILFSWHSLYELSHFYSRHTDYIPYFVQVGKDPTHSFVYLGAMFISWLLSTIIGNITFRELGVRSKRISFFCLPVSTFEKTVFVLLGSFLACVAYAILVICADWVRVVVAELVFPVYAECIKPFFSNGEIFTYMDSYYSLASFVLLYASVPLLLHSFFMLGSVVWKKLSFLKTAIVLSVSFIAGFFLLFHWIEHLNHDINGYVYMDEWGKDLNPFCLFSSIMFLVTVFNWAMTYYRLKETEVIHRLY